MSIFYNFRFVWESGARRPGRFVPASCRGNVGMGTVKGKPALSRRAYTRSSNHERQRLGEPVLLNVHTAKNSSSGIAVRSIVYNCCTAAFVALCCCCIEWYIRYTYIMSCRTIHLAVATRTPRPCDVTGRQKRELKSPSPLLFISAVQLYCAMLQLYSHGGWVGYW